MIGATQEQFIIIMTISPSDFKMSTNVKATRPTTVSTPVTTSSMNTTVLATMGLLFLWIHIRV